MQILLTAALFFLTFSSQAFTLSVSPQDAKTIGDKIWKNECSGSVELMTHWNKNEEFASLGIGHFIWYTANDKQRFQEIFPLYLKFLQQEGVALPSWLTVNSPCPWNSRDEFYKEFQSAQMKSLRQFLVDTKDKQALFMANRLESTIPEIIENCTSEEKAKISKNFQTLAKSPNGLYALIDYLNFKGAGISPTESYKGQGWGLKHVLLRVSPTSTTPLADFVKAAKELLVQRIKNSPPERNEAKWQEGWFNRLDTYLEISSPP